MFDDMFNGATIQTQLTPDIAIPPPSASTSSQPQNDWIVKLIKPKVVVNTDFGAVTIMPYGEPTANYFPAVLGGIALIGLLAVCGAYWLLTGAK